MTHERFVVPFKTWHYNWLARVSAPAEGQTLALSQDVLAQIEASNAWTGVVDGEPIVCGGTFQHWPGRHMAWAYLSPATGAHMRWITREVGKKLAAVKGRIEMTVRADFEAGLRWAWLLGFDIETPRLEQFGPQGETHTGFVRFN